MAFLLHACMVDSLRKVAVAETQCVKHMSRAETPVVRDKNLYPMQYSNICPATHLDVGFDPT